MCGAIFDVSTDNQLLQEQALRTSEINKLPKVSLTRDQFRAKALAAGWELRTVELLLRGDFPAGYFQIGYGADAIAAEVK